MMLRVCFVVLFGVVCTACGSPDGFTAHNYRYYLKGKNIYDHTVVSGSPGVIAELEKMVEFRTYYTGMSRSHGGYSKTTNLEIAPYQWASSVPIEGNPYLGTGRGATLPGTITVDTDSAVLVFSPRNEINEKIRCDSFVGTLSVDEAYSALYEIDQIEFRNSESAKQFVINWVVLGNYMDEPFEAHFTQTTCFLGVYSSNYQSGHATID